MPTLDDDDDDDKSDCVVLMANEFVNDEEGFEFEADVFRNTSQPYYTKGYWGETRGKDGTGGIKVELGAMDNTKIKGMSAGWCKSFYLDAPYDVEVSFAYKLVVSGANEPDENGQVVFSIDGNLVGLNGNDYIDEIFDGGETPYGDLVELHLGTLSAGPHTACFGGYKNQKTSASEFADIFLDCITVKAC